MLVLIGNSPSSGSTLLADLLDSTQFTACGPELGIFSNKNIYDFGLFKKNPFSKSLASSIYTVKNKLKIKHLYAYGLTEQSFTELVQGSTDLKGFIRSFVLRYLSYREKNEEGVVFEKTPENINEIGNYLSKTDDSCKFIHIVRNPAFVYKSLLKRGSSQYVALLTWFIDEAKFLKYKGNNRVYLVKYEDLVNDPFNTTCDILDWLETKNKVDSTELQQRYETNDYRQNYTKKLGSWNVALTGEVKNANILDFSDQHLAGLQQMLSLKINPKYATMFDLEVVDFEEVLEQLGYKDAFMSLLGNTNINGKLPQRNTKDLLTDLRKFANALVLEPHIGISDFGVFMRPVVENK